MAEFQDKGIKVTTRQLDKGQTNSQPSSYQVSVESRGLGGKAVKLESSEGSRVELRFPLLGDDVELKAEALRLKNYGSGDLSNCVRFSHSPEKNGTPTTDVQIDAGKRFGFLGTPVWDLVGKKYSEQLPESFRACATSDKNFRALFQDEKGNFPQPGACINVTGTFPGDRFDRFQSYVAIAKVNLDNLEIKEVTPVPCPTPSPNKKR